MTTTSLCHCGRAVEPRDPDPWEGRMDDYCEDCAINRCDCYPDECPVKHPPASSAAQRRHKVDWGALIFALGLALILAIWIGGIFGSAWLGTLLLPNGLGIWVGAFTYLFLSFVGIFYVEASS